jgi:hypothetical protein
MPANERKLQVKLSSTEMLSTIYPDPDPWDPYNCPNCRSGVMPYPVEIMADVVNVEL